MDAYTFVQTDNLKQNQVLEIMSWGKRDKCDDRINFSNSATEKKKKKYKSNKKKYKDCGIRIPLLKSLILLLKVSSYL